MDLIIQLLKLATGVVGLAAAVVRAIHGTRGTRPETETDRKL
ncbi:hypothetical protein [Parvibacter caecicola]|nr:hypothetical protein [Parvibacter caecicola]